MTHLLRRGLIYSQPKAKIQNPKSFMALVPGAPHWHGGGIRPIHERLKIW